MQTVCRKITKGRVKKKKIKNPNNFYFLYPYRVQYFQITIIIIIIIIIREMLMNALRTLVKNSIKESFYGEKKKQLMF